MPTGIYDRPKYERCPKCNSDLTLPENVYVYKKRYFNKTKGQDVEYSARNCARCVRKKNREWQTTHVPRITSRKGAGRPKRVDPPESVIDLDSIENRPRPLE